MYHDTSEEVDVALVFLFFFGCVSIIVSYIYEANIPVYQKLRNAVWRRLCSVIQANDVDKSTENNQVTLQPLLGNEANTFITGMETQFHSFCR